MGTFLNKIKEKIDYSHIRPVLLIILLLISGYLINGHYIFIGTEEIHYIAVIVLGAIDLSIFSTFLVLESHNSTSKINWYFLVSLFVLFALSTLMICLTPDVLSLSIHNYTGDIYTFVTNFDFEYRLWCIFSSLGLFIVFYSLIIVMPTMLNPKGMTIRVVFFAFLIITAVLCIYSLIAEFNNYIDFIKNIDSNPEGYHTKSIFHHRNNWGMFLFISIYASIYSFTLTKNKMFLAFPFIIFVFMFFSLCKAAILLSALMEGFFCSYLLIVTYKNNKKRNTIIVTSVAVVLIALLLFVLLNDKMRAFVSNMFIIRGDGSLASRFVIWCKVFEINKDPLNIFFGRGYGVLSRVLWEANLHDLTYSPNWFTWRAHNMYVQSYGDGGIVLFCFFVAALTYCLYKAVKYRKEDKLLSVSIVLGLIGIMAYWFFES